MARVLASLIVPQGIIVGFEGMNYFLQAVQYLEHFTDPVGFFHSMTDSFGDFAHVRTAM